MIWLGFQALILRVLSFRRHPGTYEMASDDREWLPVDTCRITGARRSASDHKSVRHRSLHTLASYEPLKHREIVWSLAAQAFDRGSSTSALPQGRDLVASHLNGFAVCGSTQIVAGER